MMEWMKEKIRELEWKIYCLLCGFKMKLCENTGASDMVAVVVLIVIVLAVAFIFKKQIELSVNAIMKQLDDFVKGTPTTTTPGTTIMGI